MDIDIAKHTVRERVWAALDQAHAVAPPGAAGHIPHFIGADQAAQRLTTLESWRTATVIKANPDKAQLPVRENALRVGKLLYMAVPKIATPKPFYLLDPGHVGIEAATSRRAAQLAPTVAPDTMNPLDMVICGSVAVDRRGTRIGKGAGYSDLEMGLLADAGLISPETTIVTTVHDRQVLDDDIPEAEHDFSVDLIVTPHEVIECGPPRRPSGILWEHLSEQKIAAIPILAHQRK